MKPCFDSGETMRKSFAIFSIIFGFVWIFLGNLDSKDRTPSDIADTQSTALKGWSAPVKISYTAAQDYCRVPRIAVDEQKNVHAIWVQESGGTTEEIRHNWTNKGKWQNNAIRTNITKDKGWEGPWPQIKVDIDGNPSVVYATKTSGAYEVYTKKYENDRWGKEVDVSATGNSSSRPKLVINPITNDYFCYWQNEEGGGFRTWTKYLIGGEGDWIDAGVVPTAFRAYEPNADVDYDGKIYLVYINRQSNKTIHFTENEEATDEFTWTDTQMISDGDTGVDFPIPDIAVDKDGNCYVVWMEVKGGNIEILFKKRVNNVWQNKAENLSHSSVNSENPAIAVDKKTKDIYVAWEEMNKVILRVYEESKGSWGPREVVTERHPLTESDPNAPVQQDFGLCVSVYGDVHLVFTEEHAGNTNIYHRFKEGREPERPVAPLGNPTLQTRLEPNDRKTNIFSWGRNPENGAFKLENYIVYRKREGQGDNKYVKMAEVPVTQFLYRNTGLSTGVKYVYAVSVIDKNEKESERSNPAVEAPIFIPQNLSVQTTLNKALFSIEKINTLTWTDSRLNDPVQNRSYKIYRKKSTDDDSAFTLIYTADASSTSFTDRGLPWTEKFVYRITVVDDGGNESPWLEADED
jgi:hypothetical protein